MDSGAYLHMISKNELASGQRDTIRKSKEPTVIMPANGKAEPTEEATENVNDLGVFFTVMLLEDSSAVLFLGFL